MKEFKPVEEMLLVESNQNLREEVKEQKQSPIIVLSEEDEKYLSDEVRVPTNNEARVCSKQEVYTHFKKETMSRRKRMKVVEFSSITHQGKVQKISQERLEQSGDLGQGQKTSLG